ncbi:MAG TPA: hypothetical protein VNY07_13785 [Chthoniobacterales bacterium]|jgi:hypothetical protein|nr:hypothetical protein [Chthoniobacterales bacterium]
MIRSHLLSLFLFALTLLLSGCATQEGNVLLGVENENLKRLQDRYGRPGALQQEIDMAKTDNTGRSRNDLLNDLILLVDLNYYHWEKLVYDKKAYADFGSAVTATTLSSISAISKVEDVKTVLSAISSGITSTGVTFNSKVLQDQSLTAIFAKMRANRATQLLRLQASMTKTDSGNNPIGPNPLSVYSVQQGLIDIAKYYNAGTFVAALQDIIEKAATEKTNSDTQSNNLKPNATLVNAAVPTAHVQTLKTVVVSEPIPQGLTRQDNIQAVVKSGGDILQSLSKDQAQKALTELKPNSLASPNPKEEITGMLMDTTTMEQAVRILTALQHAK